MTYFCSLTILLQCFNFFVYKKCNLCPADTWKVPWWLKCSTLSAFTFRRCKQHHFYFLRCKQPHFYFLWGWQFHFLWCPHVDMNKHVCFLWGWCVRYRKKHFNFLRCWWPLVPELSRKTPEFNTDQTRMAS